MLSRCTDFSLDLVTSMPLNVARKAACANEAVRRVMLWHCVQLRPWLHLMYERLQQTRSYVSLVPGHEKA